MSASIWTPGSNNIPQVDPLNQIKGEEFIATAGQTDFVITQFTYNVGANALSVYVNAAKVTASELVELSNSSFRISACDAGDLVEVVGNTATADAGGAAAEAVAAAELSLQYRNEAEGFKNDAATEATNAATSASNAATSASSAATLYDTFDDRFLGAKASNPTLDNDGNALLEGAMYWNTPTKTMRVWDGTQWVVVSGGLWQQTLTDAATIVWDWSLGNATVTLGASRTLGAPTNAAAGEYRTLRVNRSGSYLISTFNAVFKGMSLVAQTNVINAVDHFVFRYDGANFELVGYRANVGA